MKKPPFSAALWPRRWTSLSTLTCYVLPAVKLSVVEQKGDGNGVYSPPTATPPPASKVAAVKSRTERRRHRAMMSVVLAWC
jgi:hypothetical protein